MELQPYHIPLILLAWLLGLWIVAKVRRWK